MSCTSDVDASEQMLSRNSQAKKIYRKVSVSPGYHQSRQTDTRMNGDSHLSILGITMYTKSDISGNDPPKLSKEQESVLRQSVSTGTVSVINMIRQDISRAIGDSSSMDIADTSTCSSDTISLPDPSDSKIPLAFEWLNKLQDIITPEGCMKHLDDHNYMYVKVTDGNSTIYCDDCERKHDGVCPVYGPMTVVKDKIILPGGEQNGAHNTLPDGLIIKQTQNPGFDKGVWTTVPLSKGLGFGPYKGEVAEDHDIIQNMRYCRIIYRDDEPSHYIDAQDESKANWMRFVRFASMENEQNLFPLQYKGGLYYRTLEDIPAHTELLVSLWNGEQIDMVEVDFDADTSLNMLNGREPEFSEGTSAHSDENPYKCSCCSRAFEFSCDLEKHMTSHVKTLCSICGHLIAAKRIQPHMATHKEDKIYQCDQCGRRYQNSYGLRVHLRHHYVDGRYKCGTCGKHMSTNTSLTRHMLVHTKVTVNQQKKPLYKCYKCDACFNRVHKLKDHLKTHKEHEEPGKTYKCMKCRKCFFSPVYLDRHMRMMHTVCKD